MMSKFQAYSYKTFMSFDDDLIRRISYGELCYRYLTVLHIMMKGTLKLTPSSITCKKASSFPLRKEEDVALDETKEDGDLKPKPNITGDELCRTFKPSLPSTTLN